HRQPGGDHDSAVRGGSAQTGRQPEQDRIPAPAAGRSEGPPAGHHEGEETPRLGTEGRSRRWPETNDELLQDEDRQVNSWERGRLGRILKHVSGETPAFPGRITSRPPGHQPLFPRLPGRHNEPITLLQDYPMPLVRRLSPLIVLFSGVLFAQPPAPD